MSWVLLSASVVPARGEKNQSEVGENNPWRGVGNKRESNETKLETQCHENYGEVRD